MRLETVPASEIAARIRRVQGLLAEAGVGLALIRQSADLYYLTGTVQEGHLLLPAEGEPVFLVWRSLERARRHSPLRAVEPMPPLSELPATVAALGFEAGTIGLELDCLPAAFYLRYRSLFPDSELVDCGPLLRRARAIKSEWEVGCIRRACQKAWGAMETAQAILAPGVTDLEVAVAVEGYLRRQGHPGVVRMRMWNHHIAMDQVLTGPAGALPAWTATPAGGRGMSTAYGMGAAGVSYEPGMPFTVDIAGYHMGYLCDQTRTLASSRMEEGLRRALDLALAIQARVEGLLRPGTRAGAVYEAAAAMAEEAGMADWFMGSGPDRMRFVGHGIGIELDEYPFLAQGSEMALEPGMVVAVEPKFAVPGKGMVGVEDTYLVTGEGARRLTLGPPAL